ncbi:hypothetical protein NLJ89_g4289 [Agrocybe chaxingu]|uniref:C2H2-type domain-containing protein n=1 Tax=Agrocybe chaxingu TaxID=84603 RepID=A0A9W8MY33_9AGAR|nr:hypothetical protein NLJ89_g4289 [Agrocybe chaxingu]
MAFASSSRMAHKPYTQPSPPCADCNAPVECQEPLCASASALTSQCTDQCVVIACNDPDHAESMCDVSGQHFHCDLVCDDTTDCTDCHGFDAFLQCCTDYPAYNTGPSPPRPMLPYSHTQSFNWDSSFNQSWCDCTEPHAAKPTTFQEKHVDSNGIAYALTERGVHGLLEKHDTSTSSAPHRDTFQIQSYPQSPQHPPAPSSSFNCMWGNCNETFPSLSELVGHVNLHHLVTSSPPSQPESNSNSFGRSFDPGNQQAPVSCMWADCDRSYFPSRPDLDVLAYHLMREHLGVSPPQPPLRSLDATGQPLSQNVTITTPSPVLTSKLDTTENVNSQTESSAAPSPTPVNEQHSCAGAHECRWKDCGLSFPSCDELTAHITSAHVGGGKAHYECFWDNCGRNGSQGFQSKQKICRHIQSHTGHRPFQCEICQQNFSEAATLQQHIRRHTQEKPYVCDYPGCGKSFAITGALTIHKRTHNGDKPFKCSFCDRGFAESSNLSKHLRTHTGARPYVCNEPGCNKAFARPDQLNRHKGVHRKQLRGVGGTTVET